MESTGGNLNRLERQGLDRLVRALRGISVGLALAGGGAKGMAHFGVLKVLEEAGLSFDVMSGTSAGAMAGILYASGMAPEDAVEYFQRDLMPSRVFRCLPKWPNWYLLSQYRRRAWDAMLRKHLHDWRLEQLLIPFHAVTVDLVQVRTVVRRRGDAVHAILESINLPIVSRPILRDGMVLIDGGVLNNLPADVLAESNVDFVVGVDVSSRVRHEFAGNRPDMPTGKMRPAGTLDTLFRIFESQAHGIGKLRNRAVDFWIKPDTSGFGLAEFHRTAEIAAAGEAAARDKLPELKQHLVDLEQPITRNSSTMGRTALHDSHLMWLFVGLVVIPTTVWIALAVHYRDPRPWLRLLVSCVPLAVVGASLLLLPLVPWALAVWLALLCIVIAWWVSLGPRVDRDWAPRAGRLAPGRDHRRHAAHPEFSQFQLLRVERSGVSVRRTNVRPDAADIARLLFVPLVGAGDGAHAGELRFRRRTVSDCFDRSPPPALAVVFAAVGHVSHV